VRRSNGPRGGSRTIRRAPVGEFWHGGLLDAKRDASGLLYRRNRYYEPGSGRFTQEDPIGLAGGVNLYGYAGGDPVNFADPSGEIPVPLVTGLIGFGVGAAVGGYKYGWKGALIGGAGGAVAGGACQGR
jgi:RHS repeat-associated protein